MDKDKEEKKSEEKKEDPIPYYTKAKKVFTEGYSCTETIVNVFSSKVRDFRGTPVVYRIASGFAGGIGHCEDICGVLSGCIIILGALYGRDHFSKDIKKVRACTGEFYCIFKEMHGDTSCKVLRNNLEFGSEEQRKHCAEIVGKTAQALADFLKKKEQES